MGPSSHYSDTAETEVATTPGLEENVLWEVSYGRAPCTLLSPWCGMWVGCSLRHIQGKGRRHWASLSSPGRACPF